MTRALVTGGAGFVGHHFVEHLLKNTDWQIIVLDRLSYASHGLDRLRDIEIFTDAEKSKRVLVLSADFTNDIDGGLAQEIGQPDYIFHLGAESHVDRSISDAEPFIRANILGTWKLLKFARQLDRLKWFNYFSTDEVFGPAPDGTFYTETDRHNPTNQYAATKSGAEMLCQAEANTHKTPVLITNTMNVFGERQDIEKFVPLVMRAVLKGETVKIHGSADQTQSGSRHWIHARNVSDAVLWLVRHLTFEHPPYDEMFARRDSPDVRDEVMPTYRYRYNVAGEERSNLSIAQLIAETIGKPLKYEIVNFHASRPGHDLRYSETMYKLFSAGYRFPKTGEESLAKTVRWSLEPGREQWLGL